MVTKLRNEITNSRQRPDESLFEAWERYKLSIDRCPNHNMLPVTQIDTFYNGLTLRHRDTINAAAGETFMKRRPEECYDLIENMTAYHNDWDTSGNNQGRNQFFQGASHGQNPPPAYQASGYQAPMNTALSSGSGTLPSNFITNPKEDLKGITTRSGNAYKGPTIPTTSSLPKAMKRKTEVTKDTVPPTNNRSTKDVQPLVVQVENPIPNSEPVVAPIVEPVEAPTGRALIDVYEGELTLRVSNKAITFNLDQTSRYSTNYDAMSVNRIDLIDVACEEYSQEVLGFSVNGNPTPSTKLIASTSSPTLTPFGDSDFLLKETDAFLAIDDEPISPEIDDCYYDSEGDIFLLEEFLNDDPSSPPLPPQELKVLKIKTQNLLLMNHLCPWVSPVQCVPKKGGFTVVENEENELIPTRLVTGWRRLAGNEYYCFLDGFSGYFQIPIDPQDQENTIFTCPYGTFAYRHMPFGLCNAPGTFQRCMMAIFHDMIKKTMKVFMDDFSVFGNSFGTCLFHLDKMLKRCEDTNLCLNWEKSHFMVKEGIILGHKISKNGIE
nr:reverse transcriptase domain-containing protein [Tanacetum cinerariifolium]